MQLIVVRHGSAGSKAKWSRSDKLRPLDAKGRLQAKTLAPKLQRMRPTKIFSSHYTRCVETVEPLAKRLGLKVEERADLAPKSPKRTLTLIDELLRSRRRHPVVLCTHREILDVVLEELATANGFKLPRRAPGLKGCAWVLTFERRKLVRARYISPL